MCGKLREIINNEEGQSIFELVLFMPIFLYLIVVLLNVGNSINASINQQKATRGYTFFLLKGNSYGYKAQELLALEDEGAALENIGAYIIGWRFQEGSSGKDSFGSVYKLPNVPFAGDTGEDCMEKTQENQSQCIKVFTQFGVCGETYGRDGSNQIAIINYPGSNKAMSDKSACLFN